MKGLDPAQVEQIRKMGEYLRREREQRSIPLEEIAVKTYIPQRLLKALELGEAEKLPQPIFVQGFVRRYADVIGLDGLALSKTFVVEPSIVPLASAPQPVRPLPPLASPPKPGPSPSGQNAARPAAIMAESTIDNSVLSSLLPEPAEVLSFSKMPITEAPISHAATALDEMAAPSAPVPSAPVPSAPDQALEAATSPPSQLWVEPMGEPVVPSEEPIATVTEPLDRVIEPLTAADPAMQPSVVAVPPPDVPIDVLPDVPPDVSTSPLPSLSFPANLTVDSPAELPPTEPPEPPMPTVSRLPMPAVKYPENRSRASYLPFIMLAAGAAIFLLAIASFMVFKPKEVPVTENSPSSPAAPASTNAPSPAPNPPLASSSPIQVAMTLTEDAWMEVTVDGTVVFEGIQPKNFQKVWSAQKSLTIRSGNAGAVMLTYNQESAKPMGQLGEVKEISFPVVAPATPAQ